MRLVAPLIAALMAATPITAAECELIGVASTDGTGAPDRYKTGGTEVPVTVDRLQPGTELVVTLREGDLRYLALHNRDPHGNWTLAYQGPQTRFPTDDPALAGCLAAANCTHVIVSVNGVLSRFESLQSSAYVMVCQAADDAPMQEALDKTWTAPVSGWQMSYPSTWQAEVSDELQGGSGMFTSGDEGLIVGISTFQTAPGTTASALADMTDPYMFAGATIEAEEPITLAGLSGIVRHYSLSSNGQPYSAFATFLERPDRGHALWALTAAGQESARFPLAVDMLNSFRPLGDLTPPAALPPRLAVLAVGTVAQQPVPSATSAFHIPASTAEVFFDSRIIGADLSGTLTVRLTHVPSGQVLWHSTEAIPGQPGQTHLTVNQSVLRPPAGWLPGLHLISVSWDGEILGSRMFLMEDGQ